MDTHDNDEPTELQLEQQRAGVDPGRKGDLFDDLQASSWLAGIDDVGGQAAPAGTGDESVPDSDAERAAEHQPATTGRAFLRFLTNHLHRRPGDQDNGS
jgi:hypothetical protein